MVRQLEWGIRMAEQLLLLLRMHVCWVQSQVPAKYCGCDSKHN